MSEHQSDHPNEDQGAFVERAPRRVVEIKAALGALIADPSSHRMRDEFTRRVASLLARARTHRRSSLADGLQLIHDQLDAVRALAVVSRAHLDRLASMVASLNGRLELDARALDADGELSENDRPTRTGDEDSVFPGIDTLTRRIAPELTARPIVPSLGSVPLPGAAPQIVLAVAPTRVSALLESLPADIEVHAVVDRDEAVERARSASAELVIIESGAPFDGAEVLRVLGADRATDFIPVALIAAPEEPVSELRARCPRAIEVFADDVEPAAMQGLIQRVLRGASGPAGARSTDLRDATVDDLARALYDEIRRGIVDSVDPSQRDARVSLGEGSEVLAAAWRAITTIRDLVERRSNGAIRFEIPVAPEGFEGAELLSVGAEPTDESVWALPGEDPLPGRSALVVDDDPKVTAQFAQTLRAVGMTVYTRNDGGAALEAARALHPDVILTDILMPGMDGFALCRAVRRDVLLRHTPVILLSWREDLLVRMRELGAQAQGYLRKEARIEAVIARVRATVRLRARTQQRIAELPWGAHVRGRVERVGLPLILDSAAALGAATVTIGDSVSVTELEVRGGRLVSAMRTQQDGSMVRGDDALTRAVAAPSARFGVRRASGKVRENLDGTPSELLRATARRVAAVEDALTGSGLLQVQHILFDADLASGYARALPSAMRGLVERLLAGEPPRDLVLRDGVSPGELEPLLVELARRGAVREVRDREEQDLAALRLSAPESLAPPLVEAPSEPPLDASRFDAPGAARADAEEDLELSLGESLADAVFRQLTQTVVAAELEPVAPPRSSALRASTPALGTPEGLVRRDSNRIEPLQILPLAAEIFDSVAPPTPDSSVGVGGAEFDPEIALQRELSARDEGRAAVTPDVSLTELIEPGESESPPQAPAPSIEPVDPPGSPASDLSRESAREVSPTGVPLPTEPPAVGDGVDDPAGETSAPPGEPRAEPQAAPAEASSERAPHAVYSRPLQAPPEDAEGSFEPGRTLSLLLLVIVAALVSYLVVRVLFVRGAEVTAEPSSAPPAAPPALQVDAGSDERLADAGPGYVEPAPFLDGGVLVASLGLLVVPAPRPGSPRVSVVVEPVGSYVAPASIPLPEGVYRVRFETGRIRSTQFVTVRRGWAHLRLAPSEQ